MPWSVYNSNGKLLQSLAIGDDSIVEGKLDVSNAPTNGYFLQAQSGEGGGLTWAAAAFDGNLTGGQLTFPASQSASASANVLDDYEEGSWTPAISGSSYTTQVGRYVKVGTLVYITCQFQINSHGGSTRRVTGLPFTSANVTSLSTAISVSYFTGLATNVLWIGCYVENNADSMQFPNLTSAGTAVTSAAADIWGNGARVNFAGTYIAAG